MKLSVKKLRNNAVLPSRATDGSAGYDICACIDEDVIIKKGKIVKIPTGIAISLPDKNFCTMIYARSGLACNHGITLANSVGVIDSDYRGEIVVALINNGTEDYSITPSQRIAQMVITPICIANISVADELNETYRGIGGFGSTGK